MVKTSEPIDMMDSRKEHNKIRLQMTGAKKLDRSSPYGTPKGLRSPLSSPLVGNASNMEALDLNPGVMRVDDKLRKEFEEFKAKEANMKASKE